MKGIVSSIFSKLLLNRVALKLGPYVPKPVRRVVKRLLPQHTWLQVTSIYPIDMPPMNIERGLDVLLLELPQRYMPFMPVGLGYVSLILTRMGIKHQTVDFNLWLYHKFHSRRILEGLHDITSLTGYKVPDDPWLTLHYDEWAKPGMIDYFSHELRALAHDITNAHPKILALSLSETNRDVARQVVTWIRASYPEIIILVGGYDCVYPEVMPNTGIDYDYAVIGEAEGTLPALLSRLVIGEKPHNLPGILSKFDSPNHKWEPGPLVQDLDSINFPHYDWTKLNCYQSYQGAKVLPVVSSRGCIWGRCKFCAEAFPYRKRSPSNVGDELEWFAKRGFNYITFNESDIIGNHMLGICHEIMERKLKVSFFGQCRIQKEGTLEFYQTLKEAGCTQLAFGVDGWSDKVARLQNKGYTMDMVKTNLHNCHAAGIRVAVNMVIGVPGETEDDVTDCITNIKACKDDIDCFQNLNLLSLFVGSEYWRQPEKHDIRFRGNKDEIYGKYHYYAPPEYWYSDDPYIDQAVRANRMARIYQEIKAAGVPIGEYAEWQVRRDTKSSS